MQVLSIPVPIKLVKDSSPASIYYSCQCPGRVRSGAKKTLKQGVHWPWKVRMADALAKRQRTLCGTTPRPPVSTASASSVQLVQPGGH